MGHEVTAAVGDADSLRTAVADTSPDLATIDIRMPPMMGSDGAEVAASLRATSPDIGLLILGQHIALQPLVRSKAGSAMDGLSERTVETHMRSVFSKLRPHGDGTTHRRVLAVVRYLETQ